MIEGCSFKRFIKRIFFLLFLAGAVYYYQYEYKGGLNLFTTDDDLIIKEFIIDTVTDDDNPIVPIEQIDDSIDQPSDPVNIDFDDVHNLSYEQYARNFLSNEEKKVYDGIVHNSLKHVASFNVDSVNEDRLKHIYTAFMNDNPEHFWVANIKYYLSSKTKKVTRIEMVYNVSKEERDIRQIQIDNAVNDLLDEVHQMDSDYEKMKYIYEYIVGSTTYDLSAPDNQNIYSVFVYKRSVCAGYARSFQYLSKKLGMYSLYVTGTTILQEDSEIGHAWNVVKIDDQFYNIDVTWGNSTFITGAEETERYISHHYFNITNEELLKTHIFDTTFPLPEAMGTTYNYYNKEDLLFNSYDGNVKKRIVNEMIKATTDKSTRITMKFVTRDVYDYAINKLFNNGDLIYLIRDANRTATNKISEKSAKYYLLENKLIIDIFIDYK